jgi:hypothetical protein
MTEPKTQTERAEAFIESESIFGLIPDRQYPQIAVDKTRLTQILVEYESAATRDLREQHKELVRRLAIESLKGLSDDDYYCIEEGRVTSVHSGWKYAHLLKCIESGNFFKNKSDAQEYLKKHGGE